MKQPYDELVQLFSDKGCKLYITKEEYDIMKSPYNKIFSFNASCGHDNTVTLTNFRHKSSGIICKECMKIKVSKQLIEYNNDNDMAACKNHVSEKKALDKISELLSSNFDIIHTNEGCRADFIIRPKEITDDIWLGIQLKTSKGICHNLYTFRFSHTEYENLLMFFYCSSDESIWLMPSNAITHIKSNLNIGLTERSEYYKYKVDKSILVDKLNEYYGQMNNMLNTQEYFMMPITLRQQKELKYIKLREQYCHFLKFEKPEIQYSYYDFKINGKNIQEKVAFKNNSRKDTYFGFLNRTSYNNHKQPYLLGMNAYYWFHIPDTFLFFLIPENELFLRGYIRKTKDVNHKKYNVHLKINYEKGWYYKYQYDYRKLDENFTV